MNGLILIGSIFLFLFRFYQYAKNDYYFIRKSITLEQLFNILFLGFFWAYLAGRVGVFILFQHKFTDPVSFFFPKTILELSLIGVLIGLFTSYFFLCKRRKIHPWRFLDYVSLSLPLSLGYGFLAFILLNKIDLLQLVVAGLYLVLALLLQKFLFQKYNRSMLKEGIITWWFLLSTLIVSLISDLIKLYRHNILLDYESFLSAGLLLMAIFFLIKFSGKKG